MKINILFFGIICFSCFKVSTIDKTSSAMLKDSITYLNKDLKMILILNDVTFEKFELYNLENKFMLVGKPELITLDGEIPEGTNRIDNNNISDYKGFVCDSTYQFVSKNVGVSFAVEKNTKKRLDLTIYDSKIKAFKNGSYTLVNQEYLIRR